MWAGTRSCPLSVLSEKIKRINSETRIINVISFLFPRAFLHPLYFGHGSYSCSGYVVIYAAIFPIHNHNAAGIERKIFFNTADLLNLQVDLIYYDTTTASFSIDPGDETGLCRFKKRQIRQLGAAGC
jgi:hypothetical protein